MSKVTRKVGTYRYRKGITDYRHRSRMLTNHEDLVRIVVGKKTRYTYAGLYTTIPGNPDNCHFYTDTRVEVGNKRQREIKLGEKIKEALKDFEGLRAVIDKGRRKHIDIDNFLEGLKLPMVKIQNNKLPRVDLKDSA